MNYPAACGGVSIPVLYLFFNIITDGIFVPKFFAASGGEFNPKRLNRLKKSSIELR
jgi:hypothetical protein